MRGSVFFIASCFVSPVGASGNHGEFVSMDPFKHENWSSVVGMKQGYRVYTNVPDVGLTETFAVTHADGMYVAGEKVATVREVESVSSELQDTRAELQDTRAQLSHAISTLATLQSFNSHPPVCMDPGGYRLQFNGTNWLCDCNSGYYGESCQFGPTDAPTLGPTIAPTLGPTSTSPTSISPTTYIPTESPSNPLPSACVNNCAFNKSVTISPELQTFFTACNVWGVPRSECSLARAVVDGNTNSNTWMNAPNGETTCDSPLWVKIDLEAIFANVSTIVLFHYSADVRRYCAQKVEVSTDNALWTTLYHTGGGYGDVEQSSGKRIMFSPRQVRYIRHSCGRSNQNPGVHFIEIEVYGMGE